MNSDENLLRFRSKYAPMITPQEYIERSVVKDDAGCWIWQRSKQKRGYGTMQFKGKTMQAHRFSYQTLVGQIPEGMLVLHRCDVPLCINPEHLFLGTDEDNLNDCYAKGRRKGMSLERAKELKAMMDSYSIKQLSQLTGVAPYILSWIKAGNRRELP